MPVSKSPFIKGKKYLIRTVTMYWTGQVVTADAQFIVLQDAAWVADCGRYSEALEKGVDGLREVEAIKGEAIVSIGAIVDAVEWPHALPRATK